VITFLFCGVALAAAVLAIIFIIKADNTDDPELCAYFHRVRGRYDLCEGFMPPEPGVRKPQAGRLGVLDRRKRARDVWARTKRIPCPSRSAIPDEAEEACYIERKARH
jgi:hypothetical protein